MIYIFYDELQIMVHKHSTVKEITHDYYMTVAYHYCNVYYHDLSFIPYAIASVVCYIHIHNVFGV